MDDRYPVPVHKILQGASAGLYLPFALNQLWRMRRLRGDGFFVKHYELGGYTIRIAQNPYYAVVRIQAAGSVYFEFQTTGYPIIIGTGTYSNETLAATVGVTVSNTGIDATLLGGQRVPNTIVTGPLDRSQQIQLANEPAHYPGPKVNGVYNTALLRSWAPGSSHTGVNITSYRCTMTPWSINAHQSGIVSNTTRDVNYDVGWGTAIGASPAAYAYLNSPADWPRSAGIQTVIDPTYGTRTFAIYVDAFDQVSAFPVSAIVDPVSVDGSGNPIQNVNGTDVQYARVSFPTGVYNKSQTFQSYYTANPGDTGLTTFPEYDWELRHDGTKMCAVVYYQQPATFDSSYYTTALAKATADGGGKGLFWMDATVFTYNCSLAYGVYPGVGDIQSNQTGLTYTQNAPGLLEVEISITLTGSNPEDFTLGLTTNVIRDPSAQPYCPLFAGYPWSNIVTGTSTVAQAGDLCVLDVECYGNTATGGAASLLSLKNLTQDTEILTFGAEDEGILSLTSPQPGFFTSPTRILAVDMPTLSVALQHCYSTSHTTGETTTYTEAFGIGIYVLAQYKTTLFPQTLSQDTQDTISGCIAQNGRDLINGYGGLELMPISDATSWTDTNFLQLRNWYNFGGELFDVLGSQPFINEGTAEGQTISNPYIQACGFRLYDPTNPYPSVSDTPTYNWFFYCLPSGRAPAFPLLDLSNPLPGWYQYSGEVITRVMTNPNTTFFAHPNGSWAFFNQEFIYNAGGAGYHNNGSNNLTCTVPFDAANFEHCIFDQIVITGTVATTTSFLSCWNAAVTKGMANASITDNSAKLSYDNMRATFSSTNFTDVLQSSNPPVYQNLTINWQGYIANLRDHAYYTGTKSSVSYEPQWEYFPDGASQNASLGSYWLAGTSDVAYVAPQTQVLPAASGPGIVTFSSVVMVSA